MCIDENKVTEKFQRKVLFYINEMGILNKSADNGLFTVYFKKRNWNGKVFDLIDFHLTDIFHVKFEFIKKKSFQAVNAI